MRTLNFLAAFSLLLIITIGFDLYIFELPFPNLFFNKLNSILLNLSYSYFVGYITYLFSAYLPQRRKHAQKRAKLKMCVNIFFHRANLSIINYKRTIQWTKEFIEETNYSPKHSLSKYVSTRKELNLIRNEKRIKCYENIKREFSDFKLFTSSLEEYLTPNQDAALTTLNMFIDHETIQSNLEKIEKHFIKEKETSIDDITWEKYNKHEDELSLLEQDFLNKIENIQQHLHLFWTHFQ